MANNLQISPLTLFIILGILLMLGLAMLVAYYTSNAQKRFLQQQMETQQLQIQHQEELLHRNLLVQEEERQRIAAQLHDDIGSKLGVLHLTFHRLRRTDPQNPGYAGLYDEINDLIGHTLTTTRRISHELLPPTLEDFGLIEALKELCEQVKKTGAVDISLETNVERPDLRDTTTELNLFRIVQELTNNTLKYAQANRIRLQLEKTDSDKIMLHYSDDGKGFDANSSATPKGLGLKNIENRAKIIGADCEINTAAGKGFDLRLIF